MLPQHFWQELFGNEQPVNIEIGPGRGEFLSIIARERPGENFFTIERARGSAAIVQEKIDKHSLTNARVIATDANFVLQLLPDACVANYYIQFPDPWWKTRHRERRILTPTLIRQVARTLQPGGIVELITDVSDYFEHAQKTFAHENRLERLEAGPRASHCTNFARKAIRNGTGLWASIHRRRDEHP